MRTGRRRRSPFFIIDSHPVDICRTSRAERGDGRLNGLGEIGYCAGASRWFCGVREHLIFTPHGMIACLAQVPGNRHDVQGLYALLHSSFCGRLLGDNAYTPGCTLDRKLREQRIEVVALTRKDSRLPLPSRTRAFVKLNRGRVERRISLFNQQLHAQRTLCRSDRHYRARRWFKALSHNVARYLNPKLHRASESMLHFRIAS